jgi:hypothetical protein
MMNRCKIVILLAWTGVFLLLLSGCGRSGNGGARAAEAYMLLHELEKEIATYPGASYKGGFA